MAFADTKVPLFKYLWHFQIKIKFKKKQKKTQGRAVSDYQALISSGLFPDFTCVYQKL